VKQEELVSENLVYVRLKAHLPRAGHVLRQYSFRGIVLRAGGGWCKVDAGVAEHLRIVRQQDRDPYSPLAFDVCTEEEARRLDEKDTENRTEAVPVERAKVHVARDEATATGAPSTPGVIAPTDTSKERPSARAKH
jgi:hypothetical protein